jgi:glucosylceramidase
MRRDALMKYSGSQKLSNETATLFMCQFVSMRRFMFWSCPAFLLLVLIVLPLPAQESKGVTLWLTTADRSSLLVRQNTPLRFEKSDSNLPAILIDDARSYQSMDGFGFSLTGGSAQLLMKMGPQERKEFLQQLVGTGADDIAVSYLRISIGSSDMNDHAFTYDDLAAGDTDPNLAKFDLGPDSTTVVPVLKEILAINPKIKILGSPWSAPAWMKTSDALKGGSLRREYYKTYAQYFVTYLHAMASLGIHLDAITLQNEPLNPNNTPSMVLDAADAAVFIKEALGPAFHKAGIATKIQVYDHNCDRPDYPLTILNDPEARQYVDGSAFHLYGGEMGALSQVHEAYPEKHLYFTEQMVIDKGEAAPLPVAEAVARLVIAAPRNWSSNVLLWNLAADPKFGPHTDNGGCPMCEGAVTLDGNNVTKNVAWYVIAHASKFVRPGSVRIWSTSTSGLPDVAFKTPDGKHVLIVANPGRRSQTFQIRSHGDSLTATLSGDSVGTFLC